MGHLQDIVFNHPAWIAIAGIAWAAIAVWVVSLVGWMVQGEVDVLFGFLGIGVAIVLGYFSFMPPSEVLRPFTAIAIVGTAVVFPFLRHALNQRALVAIDIEAMEDAYEMLRAKPENHMQRFKLARLMYDRGQVGPALAIGSDALQGMPEKLFTDEHRMFGRWKRQNPHIDPTSTVACINCGHANPGDLLECEKCGHPHLLDIARGRWVGRDFARKLIAAWIAGILALAGIPLASLLPPVPAVIVICIIMAGAIALIWLAFRATAEGHRA